MSYFRQIQAEFARTGYTRQSKLSQAQLNQALDKISALNCNTRQFDRDIAEQLWQHTTKNLEGKVLLKDYIQTIIDAKNILNQNIQKCKRHLSLPQTKNKEELEECVFSYTEDIQIIDRTFKFQLGQSYSSRPVSAAAQRQSHVNSKIFSDEISPHQQSISLRYAFYLVVILLFCELLCMFVRHHFINLIAYLGVFSIYFLKYFDGTYIKTVLVTLFIAVISDLLWFALHSSHFWTPAQQTQYSHLQDGFLRFIVLVVVSTAIGKALLFVLLFRFRTNLSSTKKMINFCGNKVELDGSSDKNPLTRVIKGKNDQY